MPRSRPPYSSEFRQQMVELVRAGCTPEELSREFEPSSQTIRNWVQQSGGVAQSKEVLTSAEREELRRLRAWAQDGSKTGASQCYVLRGFAAPYIAD